MIIYRQSSIVQYGIVNSKNSNLGTVKSGSVKKRVGFRDITNVHVESPKSRNSWRKTATFHKKFKNYVTTLSPSDVIVDPNLATSSTKYNLSSISKNENNLREVFLTSIISNSENVSSPFLEEQLSNLNVKESFNDSTSSDDSRYSLPIVYQPQVQNRAFASIASSTLRQLILNEKEFNQNFILFDCRYPYEYNGGHIQNAINLYDFSQVSEIFFPDNKLQFKRINIKKPIFYCEFSQKRSVRIAMELRRQDRQRNLYPFLHYKEIYILDYGYQKFFEKDQFLELCIPPGYVPMTDERFSKELKQYNNHKKVNQKVVSLIELRNCYYNQKTQHEKSRNFEEVKTLRRSLSTSFSDKNSDQTILHKIEHFITDKIINKTKNTFINEQNVTNEKRRDNTLLKNNLS